MAGAGAGAGARVWRVVALLAALLLAVPLVTHYYLAQYEGGTAAGLGALGNEQDGSPEHLDLRLPHDFSTLTATDLKVRIQEMQRIKASVSAELRGLEARRGRLAAELTAEGARTDALRLEHARRAADLHRLKISLDQARLAQEEAVRRNTPELAPPREMRAGHPPRVRPALPGAQELHCRMHSCFDHSRCSLTSGFPVYLYEPDEHRVLAAGAEVDGFLKTTLRQTLGYNPHHTREPASACLYLVLVGEAFPVPPLSHPDHTSFRSSGEVAWSAGGGARSVVNETALRSLPYWGGDGRNHVLVNLARRELSVGGGDTFLGVSTGRAMLAQSTFTHRQFRPGFDVVVPPMLGPPGGEVWHECAPMSPARRRYLLSFQGERGPRAPDTAGPGDADTDTDTFVLEYLARMANDTHTTDQFHLQLSCIPATEQRTAAPIGDWALCGTDYSRRSVLAESTYALLLAPADRAYASTALLLARLYEALRSGAVPVLLGGDGVLLPYAEVLDWRRAALLLPYARITELHFLLRAIPDADLLAMRRQGRMLWERYMSSVQANVDTLLAVIRSRLNMPPRPAQPAHAVPAFAESFSPPSFEPPPPEGEPEESLGPLEAPYASPAFRRNYSVALTHGYRLWNDWGEPFALYPQLPWDPAVGSEARFLGSEAGFRAVGRGAGGAGREFAEALGGNVPREQFTVVVLTYEREAVLSAALARLRNLPYLNKVVVVWNGRRAPPPEQRWPEVGAPVAVVRGPRNSLNNRFLPYDLIETEAVLSVDDDAHLRHDEIIFAFRVWREQRDRIVGFPGRYHAWDINYNNGFLYNSNYSCELSMVLTGAAFLHRYYLWAYHRLLPQAVRDKVDELMNCEDIAMNFLVSHLTRQPPIKVTSRWTFRCPGCPVTLSADETHFHERHKCIQFFTQVFGYTPLLNTQFRADSVLFKTRIPHDKQKCFKFI